jgi:hypothetical protein
MKELCCSIFSHRTNAGNIIHGAMSSDEFHHEITLNYVEVKELETLIFFHLKKKEQRTELTFTDKTNLIIIATRASDLKRSDRLLIFTQPVKDSDDQNKQKICTLAFTLSDLLLIYNFIKQLSDPLDYQEMLDNF